MRLQFQVLVLAAVTGLSFGQSGSGSVVEVYVSDRDDSALLLGPEAKAVTSGIFEGIGIRLKWRHGELQGTEVGPAFGIRTVARAPESATAIALASAEVLGSSGAIMLYKERVRRLLADHPTLQGAAAGYVLAHELAHVMQGIPQHSESGILKAQWSGDDFKQMVLHKLAFTTLDVELIHEGLALRRTNRRSDAESGGPALSSSTRK